MNSNFAKLCAIGFVAGVVKALFGQPAIHNHYPAPVAEETEKETTA